MAIIDVKKVTVIGLKEDKESIVKSLQGMSAVEVFENTFEEADKLESSETILDLESKIADVKFALDLLKPFDDGKKPLFSVRPVVDTEGVDEFEDLIRKESIAIESLKEYAKLYQVSESLLIETILAKGLCDFSKEELGFS